MLILMELFDEYGAYNFRSFVGKSGTWRIIGTEEHKTVKLSLDTFKSNAGELKTYKRQQVMEQFKLGNITPVADSIIQVPHVDTRQWQKLVGRAV